MFSAVPYFNHTGVSVQLSDGKRNWGVVNHGGRFAVIACSARQNTAVKLIDRSLRQNEILHGTKAWVA